MKTYSSTLKKKPKSDLPDIKLSKIVKFKLFSKDKNYGSYNKIRN